MNISHGGVELACDHPTALHIAPAPHRANPSGTPPVDISLRLPMADGSEPRLESHAAVVSVRRLCEQEYRFSLRFVELAEDFRDDLYRFLEQCIHPE